MLQNSDKNMKPPLTDSWPVLGLGCQLGRTLFKLCKQRARVLAGSAMTLVFESTHVPSFQLLERL